MSGHGDVRASHLKSEPSWQPSAAAILGLHEQEDWTKFRSLDTLGQKAGVPRERLVATAAKELADNAVDIAGRCAVGRCGTNGFFVENDGPGFPGDDEALARQFSVNRPYISSKIERTVTRGQLGNGLRVVAGLALATGGYLVVETRGRRLRLEPQHADGSTRVTQREPSARPGTHIEVHLGPSLTVRDEDLGLARWAIQLAGHGENYKGRTSPHWYDEDAWYELVQSAPRGQTVRQFVEKLDGCTGNARAGQVAQGYAGRAVRSLSRAEAAALRRRARVVAKPVSAKRLGHIGPYPFLGAGYGRVEGQMDGIPYVLEAWVELREGRRGSGHDLVYAVFVNKSPVTSTVDADYRPREGAVCLFGCELKTPFAVGRSVPVRLFLNVQTPAMPLTNDGKSPDLFPFRSAIEAALGKALKAARQAGPQKKTIKRSVYDHIPGGMAERRGDADYVVYQRGLFYAIRDDVVRETGTERLNYDTFTGYLTAYENERGEIEDLHRDPRGFLYIPHTGQKIELGTAAVLAFRPPELLLNKCLYVEKEGIAWLLIKSGWCERHDCMLLCSKGYTTRAVKDVLDLLGAGEEEILFFCLHDGDAPGGMIFQTLQEATPARPARPMRIVDLGVDPWEAEALGWPADDQVTYERRQPVSERVRAYDRAHGSQWEEWLQTHRYELDGPPPAALIALLDRKMAEKGQGKLVPAAAALEDYHLQQAILRGTQRIEREAFKAYGRDEKVAALEAALHAQAELRRQNAARLQGLVRRAFRANDALGWRAAVEALGRFDLRRRRARAGAPCRGRRTTSTRQPTGSCVSDEGRVVREAWQQRDDDG